MAITTHDISEVLRPLGLNVIRVEQKIAPGLFGNDMIVDINCVASPFGNKKRKENAYTPTRILKSGNRTIVFWADGTKTIVKRAADEPQSDYAAFTAALGIKCFGSNSALKRIVESAEVQGKKKSAKRKDNKVDVDASYDQRKTDEWFDSIEKKQNDNRG